MSKIKYGYEENPIFYTSYYSVVDTKHDLENSLPSSLASLKVTCCGVTCRGVDHGDRC